MKRPADQPSRRLRRLRKVFIQNSYPACFLITFCVQGRRPVLNNEMIFQSLIQFLKESPVRYDGLPQRFVIMPDHIHLMAITGKSSCTLGSWVKAMKSWIGKQSTSPSGWKWQIGFHDHLFRSTESERRKWIYICMNPVRQGLVKKPEDWRFCGEWDYSNGVIPEFIQGAPPLFEEYQKPNDI